MPNPAILGYKRVTAGHTTDGILRSPNNMTNNTTPSPFVASASSDFGGSLPAFNAFDGDQTTFWASNLSTPMPQFLKIDLGSAQWCSTYAIMERGSATLDPDTWVLAGSADDVSYTTVDSQAAQGGNWTNTVGHKLTFTPAVPMQFRYWRLTISVSTAGSNDIVDLAALEIRS